jgi:DNA-binding beta-propeller fold protein YncE
MPIRCSIMPVAISGLNISKVAELDKNRLDFSLAYYSGDRKHGSIAVVRRRNGETDIRQLPLAAESGREKALKPIFVGLAEDDHVILLDPESKQLSLLEAFVPDAFPAHIYSDPNSNRDWFMNDGDKETGNDTLNCGDNGSSVTVVADTASADATYLKTICVGRGHHQCNFSYPAEQAPQVPQQAYVSNLKDGTVSVIGNDPASPESYLQVIATINLCEPEKDGFDTPQVPNNAFPHGLVYSKVSGKVYNLNNGYGTVAIIDPLTHEIEQRIPLKGFSNLFITPDGRYVIGRGADRKSDAEHVIARMAVLDVTTNEVMDSIDLPDVYISKYFFNAEGNKLYLTTSSSGSEQQQANLKTDAVLVFDLAALPKLKLAAELRLGAPVGTLDFLAREGKTALVFASNAQEGVVTIIDGESDAVIEKLPAVEPQPHSRLWLLRS